MLPPGAAGLDDEALHRHMTTLDDEQLSALCADLDAAEVLSKARAISMLDSAIWYATRLRWPVFPLKPRGKKPVTAHGFKDASRDPEQVRAWWTAHPEANIGIPTGPETDGGCGFDVLDIDGPAGIAAWSTIRHSQCPPGCCEVDYCPAPGPFDVHARAFTPGNGVDRGPGRHLYLPATGKGNAAGLAEGLDWRGAGGYVVAPPSVGLNGARYAWLTLPTLPAKEQAA